MQESVESAGQLVVSGGDATELLESIEKAFDQVARFVAMPIDGPLMDSVAARRDVGKGRSGFDSFDQFIAVVAFVGRNSGGRNIGDQRGPLRNVRYLSAGQDQAQRIAQGINAGMNFRSQPAARSTDRLIATVFFGAPAACWCALRKNSGMHCDHRLLLKGLLNVKHIFALKFLGGPCLFKSTIRVLGNSDLYRSS